MTDILFLTHNRVEFAAIAAEALLRNTAPELVRKLWLFDDSSTDGAAEFVELTAAKAARIFPDVAVVHGQWRSPVAAQAAFLSRALNEGARAVAKVDSDAMMPPRWLDIAMGLLNIGRYHVIGLEARGEANQPPSFDSVVRSLTKSEWVGGLFIARADVFAGKPLPQPEGPMNRRYFGWQSWQMINHRCNPAWINPPMPVFLLDRMAMFQDLVASYVQRGWCRPAPYVYGPEWAELQRWAGL